MPDRLHLHTETNTGIDERAFRRRYRIRVAIFFLCAVLVLIILSTFYEATRTLGRLDTVERERDRWQRAGDIIHELNLHEGNVVVDFGSGVGYFTLKLAHVVGRSGKILAVDIQRYPLNVLRVRAVIEGVHNVDLVLGEPDNPHLPTLSSDAVLVANTYHELVHPEPILENLYRSLKPGGRLVIVDRGPSPAQEKSGEAEEHAIAPGEVETAIRRQGFELIRRDDHFTQQPDDGLWWVIVARKPS